MVVLVGLGFNPTLRRPPSVRFESPRVLTTLLFFEIARWWRSCMLGPAISQTDQTQPANRVAIAVVGIKTDGVRLMK